MRTEFFLSENSTYSSEIVDKLPKVKRIVELSKVDGISKYDAENIFSYLPLMCMNLV